MSEKISSHPVEDSVYIIPGHKILDFGVTEAGSGSLTAFETMEGEGEPSEEMPDVDMKEVLKSAKAMQRKLGLVALWDTDQMVA